MGTFERAATWCGVVTPIVALGCVTLSTLVASSAEFTWAGAPLSDLGRPGTSTYLLFNGGLVGSALVGLLFTVALWQFARNTVERLGAVAFAITVVGLGFVGLFHLPHRWHGLAAAIFFVASPVTHWVAGTGFVIAGDREFGLVSMWAGNVHALAWAGWFVAVAIMGSTDWFAVPEMIAALTFGIWTVFLAKKLLAERSEPNSAFRPPREWLN